VRAQLGRFAAVCAYLHPVFAPFLPLEWFGEDESLAPGALRRGERPSLPSIDLPLNPAEAQADRGPGGGWSAGGSLRLAKLLHPRQSGQRRFSLGNEMPVRGDR